MGRGRLRAARASHLADVRRRFLSRFDDDELRELAASGPAWRDGAARRLSGDRREGLPTTPARRAEAGVPAQRTPVRPAGARRGRLEPNRSWLTAGLAGLPSGGPPVTDCDAGQPALGPVGEAVGAGGSSRARAGSDQSAAPESAGPAGSDSPSTELGPGERVDDHRLARAGAGVLLLGLAPQLLEADALGDQEEEADGDADDRLGGLEDDRERDAPRRRGRRRTR